MADRLRPRLGARSLALVLARGSRMAIVQTSTRSLATVRLLMHTIDALSLPITDRAADRRGATHRGPRGPRKPLGRARGTLRLRPSLVTSRTCDVQLSSCPRTRSSLSIEARLHRHGQQAQTLWSSFWLRRGCYRHNQQTFIPVVVERFFAASAVDHSFTRAQDGVAPIPMDTSIHMGATQTATGVRVARTLDSVFWPLQRALGLATGLLGPPVPESHPISDARRSAGPDGTCASGQ